MRIEHRLTVYCQCPVDGAPDVYTVIVRCARLIKVEEILAAVAALTAAPMFQEHLTQRLADVLKTEIETTGVHSGVHTRVIA